MECRWRQPYASHVGLREDCLHATWKKSFCKLQQKIVLTLSVVQMSDSDKYGWGPLEVTLAYDNFARVPADNQSFICNMSWGKLTISAIYGKKAPFETLQPTGSTGGYPRPTLGNLLPGSWQVVTEPVTAEPRLLGPQAAVSEQMYAKGIHPKIHWVLRKIGLLPLYSWVNVRLM